jgi:hypothetical protein
MDPGVTVGNRSQTGGESAAIQKGLSDLSWRSRLPGVLCHVQVLWSRPLPKKRKARFTEVHRVRVRVAAVSSCHCASEEM